MSSFLVKYNWTSMGCIDAMLEKLRWCHHRFATLREIITTCENGSLEVSYWEPVLQKRHFLNFDPYDFYTIHMCIFGVDIMHVLWYKRNFALLKCLMFKEKAPLSQTLQTETFIKVYRLNVTTSLRKGTELRATQHNGGNMLEALVQQNWKSQTILKFCLETFQVSKRGNVQAKEVVCSPYINLDGSWYNETMGERGLNTLFFLFCILTHIYEYHYTSMFTFCIHGYGP